MLFTAGQKQYIDPEVVADWFQMCASALLAQENLVKQWFSRGAIGNAPAPLPKHLKFAPQEQLAKYFSDVYKELELSAILWAVTACESRLRIDLRARLVDNDFLATQMRNISNAKSKEFLVPLVDLGIFDCWKLFMRQQINSDSNVAALGAVKPLILLRHWLAHGRYWEPTNSAANQPFATVLSVVLRFYDALADSAQRGGIRALA